jgi:hypothetical protein
MTPKRTLLRRSDEERIADLETKIADLQRKLAVQQRTDTPVLQAAEKLAKRMREFAQLALHHGRDDAANSTIAFLAGLDRMLQNEPEPRRRNRRESAES